MAGGGPLEAREPPQPSLSACLGALAAGGEVPGAQVLIASDILQKQPAGLIVECS